jgi:hypothetical protein
MSSKYNPITSGVFSDTGVDEPNDRLTFLHDKDGKHACYSPDPHVVAAGSRWLPQFQQQQSKATREQHHDRGAARFNRGLLEWRESAMSIAGGQTVIGVASGQVTRCIRPELTRYIPSLQ